MSPTTCGAPRVAAGAGLVLLVAWATCAQAAVLYVGLPTGRSFAYTTRDGRFPWLRASSADLPEVPRGNAVPAFADLDGDGVPDAMVGDDGDRVLAFRNAGSVRAPRWERRAGWDPAHLDLVVTDGQARSRVSRNTEEGWDERRLWVPDDPGTGPGAPALVAEPTPPPGGGGGGGGSPVARLMASTLRGTPPLRVTFDASASTAPDGAPLTFSWEFGDEPSEGFGSSTPGGEGGRVLRVREPSEEAVRAAFTAAKSGHAIIRFETTEPIRITTHLPQLEGDFVTVEGNGATLYVGGGGYANLIEVNGHDVIVRDIRLRDGYDNLRAQDATAYNVVFSHVSSTGAGDDGISIGYGAHDVTVQWCFLAGNTRSLFLKYKETTNVSIHHSWVMKQWARGPLVSDHVLADVRNVIVEDWTSWGARFEAESSGNLVASLFTLSSWARSAGGKANSALRLIQTGPVFTAGNAYQGVAEPGPEGAAVAPLPAPSVTTLPVGEMAPQVRRRAGCLPRDRVDQAYIERDDAWDVTGTEPLRLAAGSESPRRRAARRHPGSAPMLGNRSPGAGMRRLGPPPRRGIPGGGPSAGDSDGAPNDPDH